MLIRTLVSFSHHVNSWRRTFNDNQIFFTNLNAKFGFCFITPKLDSRRKLQTSSLSLQKTPEAQRQSVLEEEAKKEGAFSFYGTMSADHASRLLAAFRARYPFLKINHYRSGSTALLSKILTETRAGRYDFDAVDQDPGSIYEMARLKLIEKYLSPNRRFIREEMMDKEGIWTAGYHVIVVTAYNTKLVRKEDVPKSYEDLLNPRWKGKMVLDTQDADWFHTMLDYLGEEKGLTFMKRLAQLAPEMRTGHTLESQLLAAGEYSMSPILYGYRVAQMMTEGAPVDFTMIDPVITKPRLSALARQAPHPHAAILFSIGSSARKRRRSLPRNSAAARRAKASNRNTAASIIPSILSCRRTVWRRCTKNAWSSTSKYLDLDKYLRTNIEDL